MKTSRRSKLLNTAHLLSLPLWKPFVASGKDYAHYAKIFDVTESTISAWIRGQRVPAMKYWNKLARIFLLDKSKLTLYYVGKLGERRKKNGRDRDSD